MCKCHDFSSLFRSLWYPTYVIIISVFNCSDKISLFLLLFLNPSLLKIWQNGKKCYNNANSWKKEYLRHEDRTCSRRRRHEMCLQRRHSRPFLDEHITFDYCIGVSAGSANVASYLAGQRGRNLRFYVDHLNEPGYMGVKNLLRTGQFSVFSIFIRHWPTPMELTRSIILPSWKIRPSSSLLQPMPQPENRCILPKMIWNRMTTVPSWQAVPCPLCAVRFLSIMRRILMVDYRIPFRSSARLPRDVTVWL